MSNRRATIIAAGLTAFLAFLLSLTGKYMPDWPQEWERYQWIVLPAAVLIGVLATVVAVWTAFLKQDPSTSSEHLEQHNRRRLIESVRHSWIEGVLNQSLYQVARMELGLEEKPDAVADDPWHIVVQRPESKPRALPPHTRILEIFNDLNKAMLILGAPGAGKTTLLLELTRDLLDEAEQNPAHPIPVVFHLSSWMISRVSLDKWLMEELFLRYGVPRIIGRQWIDAEQVLPLLDGLDEVAASRRPECVDAINEFRNTHGLLPIAVCSREQEYVGIKTPLRLSGAIVVQPLERAQVEAYLARAGKPLEGIKLALHQDPALWELLENPLMFTIAALTYKDQPVSEVPTKGTIAQRRARLFGQYINAMFNRPGRARPQGRTAVYTREQTLRWLSYLASTMVKQDLAVFYLEYMQPTWLPKRVHTYLVAAAPSFAFILTFWWLLQPLAGSLLALVGAVLPGVLVSNRRYIYPVERINWSWLLRRGIPLGLIALIIVLPLNWLLTDDISIAMVLGSLMAVVAGLFAHPQLKIINVPVRTIPNEGIHRSARNAVFLCLVSGLIIGVLFVLTSKAPYDSDRVVYGLSVGAFVGVWIGQINGGFACLQHLILRLLLWWCDLAPIKYVRFLDYASERVFLRKVGGGYIFVHQLLQDYFASLGDSHADGAEASMRASWHAESREEAK